MWDNSKTSNIHITASSESGKSQWAQRVFEEIKAEKSPNLAKVINSQMQEAKQTLHRIKPKKSMPRAIIIKLLKTKVKK